MLVLCWIYYPIDDIINMIKYDLKNNAGHPLVDTLLFICSSLHYLRVEPYDGRFLVENLKIFFSSAEEHFKKYILCLQKRDVGSVFYCGGFNYSLNSKKELLMNSTSFEVKKVLK